VKVGVVGATGVLGRALIPMLLEERYTVRAVARSPEKVPSVANLKVVQGDLLVEESAEQWRDLLSGCDAVLHTATAVPADATVPGAWVAHSRLRTEGTRRLLDASLAVHAKYYIQQSIVMAYPDGGGRWLDEDTPLDTSPEHERTAKPVIAMEAMVRAVAPNQMGWCILRGGAFMGPGTDQAQTIDRLRKGKETVPCDGRNFISPIHVADMASAFVAALRRQPPHALFNIVDEPIRQGDYLDRLASLVGTPIPQRDPARPCPPSWRCSNHAARTQLGWSPTHSIWPAS
jgi:nucleoside-diphosphate-sugar epimerase